MYLYSTVHNMYINDGVTDACSRSKSRCSYATGNSYGHSNLQILLQVHSANCTAHVLMCCFINSDRMRPIWCYLSRTWHGWICHIILPTEKVDWNEGALLSTCVNLLARTAQAKLSAQPDQYSQDCKPYFNSERQSAPKRGGCQVDTNWLDLMRHEAALAFATN